MDHYAADAAAAVEHPICATPSMSAIPPVAVKPATWWRHGKPGRPRVLMSAVLPIMRRRQPIRAGCRSGVDGLRGSPTNRASSIVIFRPVPSADSPPGAKPLEAVIGNWWRQGMIGGAKAHYDGIKAFSKPTSPKT
jgi:non-heme chloroperoxidase